MEKREAEPKVSLLFSKDRSLTYCDIDTDKDRSLTYCDIDTDRSLTYCDIDTDQVYKMSIDFAKLI